MNKITKSVSIATMSLYFVSISASDAALSVTSTSYTYTQDFNSLSQTGATSTSNPWANDSTISGWSLFTGAGAAIASYAAGTGSNNAGSFYSFGATGSPDDRAFGAVATGSSYFGSPTGANPPAGYLAVSLTNDTGAALNSIKFSFSGEQWRNSGAGTSQGITLQYGFGSAYGTVATWTAPGGNFNWSGPLASGSAGAVDGNAAGSVTGRGGILTTSSWGSGDTIWLRWSDVDDTGSDHGLALDDFRVTGVPEASTFFIATLGMLQLLRRRR